ncbi:MAG: hypothetical protein VX438_14095 [Planctomycetota bacterium]|nr:hypothetical protein [Planctomycetota bacterium]
MNLKNRLQFCLVAFCFFAWMLGPLYLFSYGIQKAFPGNYWLAASCMLFPFLWFPFAFYCQKKIHSQTVKTILRWLEGEKNRGD